MEPRWFPAPVFAMPRCWESLAQSDVEDMAVMA